MKVKDLKLKLNRFKKEYKKAIEENKEIFIFDGQEFLVSYAKYLIEYLEQKSI